MAIDCLSFGFSSQCTLHVAQTFFCAKSCTDVKGLNFLGPKFNDSLRRKFAKIGILKKIFKKSPDFQKET